MMWLFLWPPIFHEKNLLPPAFSWPPYSIGNDSRLNGHVIGKSENQALPKKHKKRFYEWNVTFQAFRQIQVMSFWYPRWNPCIPSLHHVSAFEKYRHQLFTISFHESPWFQFLARALKNVLSQQFSMFWARVSRVTGTKQLFWCSLNMYNYLMTSWVYNYFIGLWYHMGYLFQNGFFCIVRPSFQTVNWESRKKMIIFRWKPLTQ